jgi:hypothetical protein
VRTILWIGFPANREKYREIHEFATRNLPSDFSMVLNPGEFLPICTPFKRPAEQGIITHLSGNNNSLIPTFRSTSTAGTPNSGVSAA